MGCWIWIILLCVGMWLGPAFAIGLFVVLLISGVLIELLEDMNNVLRRS